MMPETKRQAHVAGFHSIAMSLVLVAITHVIVLFPLLDAAAAQDIAGPEVGWTRLADDRLPIRRDPLADMHHWLDPDALDHRRALDVPQWRKAARPARRWLAFEGLRLGVLVLWALVTGGTLTALDFHYGLLSPPAALDRPLAAFLAGIWLGLAALAFGYFGRRWLRRAQLRRPDDVS